MTISEFVKTECAINLERLRQMKEDDDVSFDIYFWESMDTILPTFFQQLSDAGLLSNGYVAHKVASIIDKAFNHTSLSPIHSIEDDPLEWFDAECIMGRTGAEIISDLKDRYYNTEFNGYLISNKRCSSVYYNPYTMKYHDTELAHGYYNDLTGIGWTGYPFEPKFAAQIIPNIAESLKMSRFRFDTTISKFPYTPAAHHDSLPVTWEEESLWDFLDIIDHVQDYKGDEFSRSPVQKFTIGDPFSYLVFIHFNGASEKATYLLYLVPMKDKDGKYTFITHLMPYQLPFAMSSTDIETTVESHRNFMASYLLKKRPTSIYYFHSPMNLLEPEDNKDLMWSFFISADEVALNDTLKSMMHINDGYLYLPKDYASILHLAQIQYENDGDVVYSYKSIEIINRTEISSIDAPEKVKDQIAKVYNLISKHDHLCHERGIALGLK